MSEAWQTLRLQQQQNIFDKNLFSQNTATLPKKDTRLTVDLRRLILIEFSFIECSLQTHLTKKSWQVTENSISKDQT